MHHERSGRLRFQRRTPWRIAGILLVGAGACASRAPREFPIASKYEVARPWTAGDWTRSHHKTPDLEYTVLTRLIEQTPDVREWWECEITPAGGTADLVAFVKLPDDILNVYCKNKNGEAEVAALTQLRSTVLSELPDRMSTIASAGQFLDQLQKRRDARDRRAERAKASKARQGENHPEGDGPENPLDVDDVSEVTLEVGSRELTALRLDLSGGKGVAGLKVKMWFVPEVPGSQVRRTASARMLGIPIGSMVDEILEWGHDERPEPRLRVPG